MVLARKSVETEIDCTAQMTCESLCPREFTFQTENYQISGKNYIVRRLKNRLANTFKNHFWQSLLINVQNYNTKNFSVT